MDETSIEVGTNLPGILQFESKPENSASGSLNNRIQVVSYNENIETTVSGPQGNVVSDIAISLKKNEEVCTVFPKTVEIALPQIKSLSDNLNDGTQVTSFIFNNRVPVPTFQVNSVSDFRVSSKIRFGEENGTIFPESVAIESQQGESSLVGLQDETQNTFNNENNEMTVSRLPGDIVGASQIASNNSKEVNAILLGSAEKELQQRKSSLGTSYKKNSKVTESRPQGSSALDSGVLFNSLQVGIFPPENVENELKQGVITSESLRNGMQVSTCNLMQVSFCNEMQVTPSNENSKMTEALLHVVSDPEIGTNICEKVDTIPLKRMQIEWQPRESSCESLRNETDVNTSRNSQVTLSKLQSNVLLDFESIASNRKEKGIALAGSLGIESQQGESFGGSSQNDMHVTLHNARDQMTVSACETDIESDFEITSNNSKGNSNIIFSAITAIESQLEEFSSVSIRDKRGGIFGKGNSRTTKSVFQDNVVVDSFTDPNNSEEVGTIFQESMEIESPQQELSNEDLQNEVQKTSFNENSKRTESILKCYVVADLEINSNISEKVNAVLQENVEIDMQGNELLSEGLQEETQVTSCKMSSKTTASRLQDNVVVYLRGASNNTEESSLSSESFQNETQVTSCNKSSEMTASRLQDNVKADPRSATNNTEEVSLFHSEIIELDLPQGESSEMTLQNETQCTSRDDNNKVAVSRLLDDASPKSVIASHNSEKDSVTLSETIEIEWEQERLSNGNLQEEIEFISCDGMAEDFQRSAEAEHRVAMNDCQEIEPALRDTIKIEPGLEEPSSVTGRDETGSDSCSANAQITVFDFLGIAESEVEETCLSTVLDVKVEEECREIEESMEYPSDSELFENQEVKLENYCGSIKLENDVSDYEVDFNEDASQFSSDSEETIDAVDNNPWSTSKIHSEINDPHSTKFPVVRVILEDLFSDHLRQLGKAHSNTGSCLCVYCKGEYRHSSDLKHAAKRPRRKNQRVTSENLKSRSAKNQQNQQRARLKTCRKLQQNESILRCKQCPLKFEDRDALKVHMNVHIKGRCKNVNNSGKNKKYQGGPRLKKCPEVHDKSVKAPQNAKSLKRSQNLSDISRKHLKSQRAFDSKTCEKVQEKKKKFHKVRLSEKAQKRSRTSSDDSRKNLKTQQGSVSKTHQKAQKMKNRLQLETTSKRSKSVGNKSRKHPKNQQRSDSQSRRKVQKENIDLKWKKLPKSSQNANVKSRKRTKNQRGSDSKTLPKLQSRKKLQCGKSPKCSQGISNTSKKNQRGLERTIKRRKLNAPLQCEKCPLRYVGQKAFKAHLRWHETPYHCKFCGERFALASAMRIHWKIHNRTKQWKCAYCPSVFWFRSLLESHMRVHTKERPFKCDQCPADFPQKASLTVHKRTHVTKKQFKCAQCPSIFRFKSNLTVHLRVHSGEKPFKCKHCPLEFVTSTNLKNHSRRHTGEKPYECRHCPAKFSQSSTLIVHLRVHTGEKPYKCRQCPLTFAQSSGLNSHVMNIHKNVRPFACSQCPWKFKWKAALEQHLRMHNGVKPHQCELCPGRFTSRRDLRIHQSRHYSQDPFACEHCSASYKTKTNLILHIRKAH